MKLGKLLFLSNFLSRSEYLVWDQCGTIHVEESFELLIYLPVDLQKAIHQTLQVAAAAAAAWGSSERREGGAVTTLPAGRSLQVPSPSSVTTDGRGLHTCVTVWFPWDRNPHHPPGSQDTTHQPQRTSTKPVETNTWLLWNILFDTEGYSGC